MDLIPGQIYSIIVQSESGKLTSNNTASGRTGGLFVYTCDRFRFILVINDHFVAVYHDPAPARVTALQADNDHTTHSLTVTWERPVGVFDSYSLQLLDEEGSVLINRTVAMESRSEQLEELTSGKWYKVRVVTLSGGVPSLEATAEGQTRKKL